MARTGHSMSIPGYELLDRLVHNGVYALHRARALATGQPVLVKTPTRSPLRAADLANLKREQELLRGLTLDGVVRVTELGHDGDRAWLVLEDRGLQPLPARLVSEPPDLDRFFSLAVTLCGIVADLHRRDLIHGGLNPGALMVGTAYDELQIVDFSLAQRAPIDPHATAIALLGCGGAAYMAPEQTGRINRSIDHRADLYTLGAVFYEILTGRPPFAGDDQLELVHSHLARTPRPPDAVRSGIPEQISRIVMRLLAKGAEDRYRSAAGLRNDLETCRQHWRESGSIPLFAPGQRDFSERLLIPQRLYGREAELSRLMEALDEALQGRPALLLVAGYSGVGKTSFINELCRPMVRQRGYFIIGKFDQVARNVPYGALIQAFRSLIWQLLAEKEERLEEWRSDLQQALGVNGGVVAAVIPEIEFIIGPQPPPVPLDAVESQNRFRYVFQSFVGTFSRPGHPLVLFLDDLQWIDDATSELLQALLLGFEQRPLVIIGAYRDNEVDAAHPLSTAIGRLERAGARVRRLKLESLDQPSLMAFLADTLRIGVADVEGLAALIRQKTDGNPFFVIQFLQTLLHDGLLSLDVDGGGWGFRLDDIAASATTDNVVAFMTQRIQRLSPGAQAVLRLAACIGSPFKWQTFLTASPQSIDDATAGLHEALNIGLIRPAEGQYDVKATREGEGGSYAFLHDRVQQAAYALIPEAERPSVHLNVGRELLAECGPEVPDDRLFEIASHLNVGAGLMHDRAERLALAQLNLAAGRKAKVSVAYRAALDYLQTGISLCSGDHWRTEYALVFALHFEHAECLYLAGDFDDAERAHRVLLTRAASRVDEAAVHELRVTFYENRSRYAESVASGRDGLALFGLMLPDGAAAVDAALDGELGAIQVLLADRSIGSLVDLPVMTDPEIRAAMRILPLMWAPVYISGNQPLTSLISAMMVRLSLAHGNTEDSAYGYVTHAITVGPVRRDFRAAYEWGELALAVNERFADTKRRAKIHQQIHAHVKLWRQPFEACIPHARAARRSGLEAGDFAYAGYGAATESWPALPANRDLTAFVADFTPALAFLAKINMTGFRDALRVMINWALALQGRTAGRLSLTTDQLDEEDFIARYSGTAPLFMTILRWAKLHLAVVFEDIERGVSEVEETRAVTIPGTIWPVLQDFWGALALAAAYPSADAGDRPGHRLRIESAARSLRELADNCPENFRCFWLLVSAELARIDGRTDEALRLYEETIAYAQATDNLQQQALASDLCARLLVARGDTDAGATVLAGAYRCYRAWGAAAKLRQLEERYGALLPSQDAAIARDEPADEGPEPDWGSLDVTSVVRVTQAITGEMELDGLLRQLMTIAIENAGAERGIFLQARGDEFHPVVEATAENDRVEVRRTVAWDAAGALAHGVVRYVRRTGQDVVIGDAATDERFTAQLPDPGSIAARSVLCVPVGEHGQLRGILYLEHTLSEAFTLARTETVRVLAAQAAIAFENAQLYERMKDEVDRRAGAERALREAMTELDVLKRRLEAENVYLQEEIGTEHNFNEIIGNSPALREALRRVERVAPTESTVLIVGETGTGKELFARALHGRSSRRHRALVKVNCGAIPPGLVESELFGHVKGAFTGAVDHRVGRFALADGGTIFLDEVGELPLDAQVKLLRVLQEHEFEPVGSSRTMRVDVRVITATNRNLEDAVAEGRFRADLLYRLKVFPIEIPPLRQRRSDIRPLVEFLLAGLARKLGKPIERFSDRSLEALQRYDWPGNVRELQNVVERAAILGSGPVLALEQGADALAGPAADRPSSQESLDAIQRAHILAVLEATGGIIEGSRGAAVKLGLHPNTLRGRMKKLGIAPARRAR